MSTLREQQFAFAAHLRAPDAHAPPPGVEDRRMAVYRELFLNNIATLLAGVFPVIRRTLPAKAWDALVRDFHVRHRARTPLFTEIGQEFIAFLRTREAGGVDPPWLQELAHYEWIELALQIDDAGLPAYDAPGTQQALLTGIPVVSPFAWALAYRWPVHAIGPDRQPVDAPESPTLLLARRDAAGDVQFSALSPLVHRLLQLLDEASPESGDAVLRRLANEAQAADMEAFLSTGAAMLWRLHAEGTLLGIRPGT